MMRCHVPVITTNIPGVDEIIEHGENGFIVSGSEDASKLLLALDKQAIRLAGEKSAAYIDEHYNLNIIADQYADLWRTALHQKQQTALGFRNM
jgi:glycosyltransferase involved in cell wall biosynthesis